MITIKQSEDGQFYHVVKGDNFKVLVECETMKSKNSVFKNIEALRKAVNGPIVDETVEPKQTVQPGKKKKSKSRVK